MSSTPELSVLVVSYNTRELTLACLRSLVAETTGEFEVILLDNASEDGSAEAVAAEFPEVRLVASRENLGFARGNNEAAALARGRLLLLLNPDTVVLDGAVSRLVEFARAHPERRLWGGRTLFGDRSLNPSSCWGAPTPWSTFCLASGLAAVLPRTRWAHPEGLGGWRRDDVREVDVVSGCLLMIEADLWRTLGGFDPTFFMYGEDADLCLRARAAGARPTITPTATIVHYGGASERVWADKVVRLFVAKAQLFARHWRGGGPVLGVRLLDLWAWTRAVGYGLLAWTGPRRRAAAGQWREVLRRRGEWHAAAEAARATGTP